MTALHRAESRAYRTLRAHSLSIQRHPDLNCLCSLSVAIKYVDSPVSALGLASRIMFHVRDTRDAQHASGPLCTAGPGPASSRSFLAGMCFLGGELF